MSEDVINYMELIRLQVIIIIYTEAPASHGRFFLSHNKFIDITTCVCNGVVFLQPNTHHFQPS